MLPFYTHVDSIVPNYNTKRLRNFRSWEDDAEFYSEAQASLQCLRKAGDVLLALQKSLQTTTDALKKTLLPLELNRGIDTLPDSILAHIFEFVAASYSDKWRQWPHLKLSLVNRRFRDVVSNSPRLWRSISEHFDPETTRTFLSKSKAAGLEVNLGAWWPDGYIGARFAQIPEALPMVLPHAGRWEELNLCFAAVEQKLLDDTFNSLTSFRLPRLRDLKISYSRLTRDDRHPNLHFYKTWELSSLRSLTIYRAIPKAFTAPLLTSLTISNYDSRIDFRKLLKFISENRALEEILLDFSSCRKKGSPILEEVVLENVKIFKLELKLTSIDDLYSFRKALRIPNVREISLNFKENVNHNLPPTDEDVGGEDRRVNSNKYFEFLLYGDEPYPHLESLSFEHDYCKGEYTLPFHKTPNLRTLKLHTSSRCPSVVGLDAIPPLRELHIYLHDSSWSWWMTILHQKMLEQHRLQGLKTIVVHHENRSIGDIGRLFANSRVVWEGAWLRNMRTERSEVLVKFVA